MADFWGGFQAVPNPGAQQVAPTFTTPVQSGGSRMMGGPVSSTRSPGMMGPNGPMIPPGPNQSQFPGQQNPNAPYAGINTGGGQYPLSSVQGTGFLAPFNAAFNRPDPNQIQNDPSFKFQMEQGTEALERSALARGTALGGGQMKELARFGQGLASTFDDKYYGRAKGEYDTARDIFNQNKQSQYGVLADQRNAGQQAATNQSDIAQGQGNAQAAGTMRQGSVYGNLVNNAGRLGASAYDQWDYNRQQQQPPNLNPFVQQGPYQFPGQQYTMGQNPGRQWAGPTDPYQQYLT